MKRWGVCVLAVALAGCGGKEASKYTATPAPRPSHDAAPWPAPANPLHLIRAAGLKPERHEFLAYHVHAHLDVFVNGAPIRIPAGIGIDIADPGVKTGKSPDGTTVYGFIKLCRHPCISPLHTHGDDGILHTESAKAHPNDLGEFFTEWGVQLRRSCVGGYCGPKARIALFVDGKRYSGDPGAVALTNRREIAIVIGSPPEQIPSTFPSG
jgi:hypothetical protein